MLPAGPCCTLGFLTLRGKITTLLRYAFKRATLACKIGVARTPLSSHHLPSLPPSDHQHPLLPSALLLSAASAATCRLSSERFLRRWSTAMPMVGANLAGMPASC